MRIGISKGPMGTTGSPLAAIGILVSSACCVGPLSIGLSWIGLSTSTALAIESVAGPFRPVILVGSALLLGVSFYQAYRPLERCDPDAACAAPRSRRLQRIFTWSATTFFAVLLYFTYIHPNLDVYFGIYL